MTNYTNSSSLRLTADHFAGVRSRRIFAVCFDLCVVGFFAALAYFVLFLAGIVTLGLAWLLFPFVVPAVGLLYNGFTISGPSRATWGMNLMDLEVRQIQDGSTVSFLLAALHAVLFYASWTFPFVFLISLVAQDKRCLHDMLSGVIVMRRSN